MAKDKNKAEDTDIEEIQEELAEEEQEVSQEFTTLQNKVVDLEQHYRRALADYQNLEKRTFEEKREWIRHGNKDLLLKLLPVLDTLMLAQKHLNDKGLELSIQQFLDVLEKEGVKQIETKGKEFNPHMMEVIEIVDGEDGKVLEEIRAGYMLYDKVLRPAQVKVGKK